MTFEPRSHTEAAPDGSASGEQRPCALPDADQHLFSRHAAAPLNEQECWHARSSAESLDMLDEGGPLRAED